MLSTAQNMFVKANVAAAKLRKRHKEDGLETVEYALMVAAAIIVVAVVIVLFKDKISGLYNKVGAFLDSINITPISG